MEITHVHEDLFEDEREEARRIQKELNQANESKVRNWVYPLICNMGSFQTIAGKQIYLVTPHAGKSLKKLSYEMWKTKELEKPFIRYYLLEWNFINDNFLPLVYTQREDKKLLSDAMRLLWVITADFTMADLVDFELRDEFMKKRNSMVDLLFNKEFIDLLVKEIEICASAAENILDSQIKMLRFIFGTIYNLLRLKIDFVLPKIISNFAKDGSVFDAMIYLTQHSTTPAFKELFLTICLIISRFSRYVTPKALFGNMFQKDPEFKRIMEAKKLMSQRRKRNVVSSRHSRFGAMISVKRDDNTTMIVSNPNALRDKQYFKTLERREGQLKKRLYGTYQQSMMDKRSCPELKDLTKKKKIDSTVVHYFKTFLIEFLDFGFINMATFLEQVIFSPENQMSSEVDENILIFIELMTFIMECVLVIR
jgi:hypothetical protein